MAAQFVHLAEHRDSNYAFADWNLRLGLARPGPAPGLGALAPAGPLPKGAPAFMVTGALASSDHAKARAHAAMAGFFRQAVNSIQMAQENWGLTSWITFQVTHLYNTGHTQR
jgi:hypothetical protein